MIANRYGIHDFTAVGSETTKVSLKPGIHRVHLAGDKKAELSSNTALMGNALRRTITAKVPAATVDAPENHAIAKNSSSDQEMASWVLEIATESAQSLPEPPLVVWDGRQAIEVNSPDQLPDQPYEILAIAVRCTMVGEAAILKKIAQLKSIRKLRLSNFSFDQEAMRELAGSASLEVLDFGGCEIAETHLDALRDLPSLKTIMLGNTKVTDHALSLLIGHKRLRQISLLGTAVSDRGMTDLAALPSLRVLHLTRTAVTDEGLKALALRGDLMQIMISQTNITAAGIAAFKESNPQCKVTTEISGK